MVNGVIGCNDEVKNKVKNKVKIYKLKLKSGNYVASYGDNGIMEVKHKKLADIFFSIDEAEKFCAEHWIEASIVD